MKSEGPVLSSFSPGKLACSLKKALTCDEAKRESTPKGENSPERPCWVPLNSTTYQRQREHYYLASVFSAAV